MLIGPWTLGNIFSGIWIKIKQYSRIKKSSSKWRIFVSAFRNGLADLQYAAIIREIDKRMMQWLMQKITGEKEMNEQ